MDDTAKKPEDKEEAKSPDESALTSKTSPDAGQVKENLAGVADAGGPPSSARILNEQNEVKERTSDGGSVRQDPGQTESVQKPYVPQKDQPAITPLAEKIVKTTYTKNQLLRRIRLLNDFISYRLFSPQGTAIKDLKEQIKKFFEAQVNNNIGELSVIAQEADWLNKLDEDFFSHFTTGNFNVAFDELEKELSTAVPIIIYLPFFMPEPEQKAVGDWLKQNISPQTLFETNFNANLVGGCSLSYKGVMKDYSILGRIEANKQQITYQLKTFRRQ